MNWLTRLMISSVAVVIAAHILPGVYVDGCWTAIVVAVVLSLFNALLKPLLIILTIPVTILTFGLFLFAINAMLILLADYSVDGFEVHGFWWALIFSLLMSFLNSLMGNSKKNMTNK